MRKDVSLHPLYTGCDLRTRVFQVTSMSRCQVSARQLMGQAIHNVVMRDEKWTYLGDSPAAPVVVVAWGGPGVADEAMAPVVLVDAGSSGRPPLSCWATSRSAMSRCCGEPMWKDK